MLVSELIERLKTVNPNAKVIISSDEEGNSYRLGAVSTDEIGIWQGDDLIAVNRQAVNAGEYRGWEDQFFDAVVFW